MQYDYLIVGSGLTGATLAHLLTEAGKHCLVVEKRAHIGGNVYTERVDGIDVHRYGAHIFHTNNDALWAFVNRFVYMNRYTNSPVANYKGELYNLPFNMNTFYRLWGVKTPQEAMKRIEAQRKAAHIARPTNLEEQAISQKNSGGVLVVSCQQILFVACLCASLLTTITLTHSIRAYLWKAIQRWWSGYLRVATSG